jgi:alanine racemase
VPIKPTNLSDFDFNPEGLQTRGLVELSSQALINNYRVLLDQSKNRFMLPMIKADAYGHGAEWAAKLLKSESQLFGFGVATIEEAIQIRECLGIKYRHLSILPLSGCAPWNEAKANACRQFGLTPVIASEQDLKSFIQEGSIKELKYHLKFNTGMNRLGIHSSDAQRVFQSLKEHPKPEGILTHLACAENAEHPLTLQQIKKFKELRSIFASYEGVFFHFANSSSIWNAKYYELEKLTDIVRPGISLYGVEPWQGAPLKGLKPVMQIGYKVIQRRTLRAGDMIGYGGVYTVKEGNKEVAILGAGYADGFLRAGSSRATFWIDRHEFPVLGRISMDLSAVECPSQCKVGETAYLIGQGIDPWRVAEQLQTIPYEILTSAKRLPRIDIDQSATDPQLKEEGPLWNKLKAIKRN